MLNGSGGYIKINGGDIEIGTSGAASFKASMKELAGGASASAAGPELSKAGAIKSAQRYDEQFVITDDDTAEPIAGAPYRIENAKGKVIAQGFTDAQGRTLRVKTTSAEKLAVHWGH